MYSIIDAPSLDDEERNMLYSWLSRMPVSRPCRNMPRDFADGLPMAEILKHYYPRLVDLHNYPESYSIQQRLLNWSTLNTRVFRKMGFEISPSDLSQLSRAEPHTIEKVLNMVKRYISSFNDTGLSPSRSPSKAEKVSPAKAIKEKQSLLQGLRETEQKMRMKILKLEEQVMLNENKIKTLTNRLEMAGI